MNKDIDKNLSRRALMNFGVRAVAGVGLLGGDLTNMMVAAGNMDQSSQAPRMKHEMRDYTAGTFLPHVGHILCFEAPPEAGVSANPIRFELLAVLRPGYGSPAGGFREPFSLLFALIDGEPSAQGLHRVVHEDFAPCDWLLSRVFVPGKDPRVPYYEAVFG